MKNGSFVISLDFELHWGIFDHTRIEDYKQNLDSVEEVIMRLLDLSERYNIQLTFAIVGFLFARNRKELEAFIPSELPSYVNEKYDPYIVLSSIGDSENDDPYHYAPSLIEKIKNHQNHEIGTHTFSHYYCLENGQTTQQFAQDMRSAKNIAKRMGVDLKSIVFPRNQLSSSHLEVCRDIGIISYRGTERHRIFKHRSFTNANYLTRLIRLADSYFNITGPNTYSIKDLETYTGMVNIPSSRFLRPFNRTNRIFEPLKVKRIKKAMQYAANNNEVFHLWWHPHNFGNDIDKNFINLEQIFKEYKELNETSNFRSITMTGLAKEITS